MRCTALAQRQSEELVSYFVHALSAIPRLFFKDVLMRRIDKNSQECLTLQPPVPNNFVFFSIIFNYHQLEIMDKRGLKLVISA